MSTNVFDTYVFASPDKNTYNIDDLNIDFLIGFKKEYNEFSLNRFYDYRPLDNTYGVYPKVEFDRKYPMGYIKMKDKDLWLYEKNNKLYFDLITCGDFTEEPPLVVWFDYPKEGQVVVFKYLGYGLESIIKRTTDKITNLIYMNYTQNGNNVRINWVNNVNDATKFVYKQIRWNDMTWIKLHNKDTQNKLLSGSFVKK